MNSSTASRHDSPLVDAPTEGHLIRWARYYDRGMALFTLGREARMRSHTVEAAGIQPGERVLDVGCGTGTLALAAAERTGGRGEVVGIDPSAAMIAVAREKAAGRAGVRFEIAAIESLPFADASFDVALSSLMFHHLPRPLQRAGLIELRRVLRPSGRLIIVDMQGGGPRLHQLMRRVMGWRRGWHGHGHGRGLDHGAHDLDHVAELAAETGFVEVDIQPFKPRFLRLLSARAAA